MKPTRIWKYVHDMGMRYDFAIETARGVFVSTIPMHRLVTMPRRYAGPDAVDVWHPVPRWMLPGEVLRSLQP